MSNFNQYKFNEFALDNGVIGFFENPVRLKSGRTSNWYINWRTVAGDVFLLDQLANHVIAFTLDLRLNPDCFFGVPEGATKLGVITQYKWALQSSSYAPHSHALPMGRGIPKEHGIPKDKYFVGEPKGKTIILEDVTTTGDSLLTTIDSLTEAGIKIASALSLTNRMEKRDDGSSVQQEVEARNISYRALSNAIQLLPLACKRLNPSEEIVRAIEEEFERYGVERIRLR